MAIETERLILRYRKEEDVSSVFSNYANDEIVTRFLSWPPHQSEDDTRKIFQLWDQEEAEIKRFHFFIERKEAHELIGSINLVGFQDGAPEIGYVIGRKWWNQGYMSEACAKMIEVLFDAGYQRIVIGADVNNLASNRVIQKCGLTYFGQKENYYPLKDMKSLCNYYEIKK